jgi:uncharacterized protein YbjT (DUF2867 family)
MLLEEGHAVRVTTRSEAGRAAIEALGAQCWVGTPERLATLRGALEGVTVVCWLLGNASGGAEALAELHTSRLEYFLTQTVDTTVRGFVYEAGGSTQAPAALAEGEQIVARLCERNAIPMAVVRADPAEPASWLKEARAAIEALLMRR